MGVQTAQNEKYRIFISLQILRAVAFLCIFLFHNQIAHEGFSRFGVAVFFILSGFLNAIHGADKEYEISFKNCISYAIRKVKKIYPLHVIMTFIALFLWLFSNWAIYQENLIRNTVHLILKLITNVLLISDFWTSGDVLESVFGAYNIVSWFLSASFFLYFCTPILLRVIKKINKPVLPAVLLYACTIVIDVLLVLTLGPTKAFWFIYECPLFRLGDYMIGLLMGIWYVENIGEKDLSKAGLMGYRIGLLSGSVLAILLLIVGSRLGEGTAWLVNSGFYFTIPAAIIVLCTAILDDKFRLAADRFRLLALGVLMGDISAYAFLIHVPVINLVHGIYKRLGTVNLFVWFVVSFVITVILSVIARNTFNNSTRG